jgi:hypothetical protein
MEAGGTGMMLDLLIDEQSANRELKEETARIAAKAVRVSESGTWHRYDRSKREAGGNAYKCLGTQFVKVDEGRSIAVRDAPSTAEGRIGAVDVVVLLKMNEDEDAPEETLATIPIAGPADLVGIGTADIRHLAIIEGLLDYAYNSRHK